MNFEQLPGFPKIWLDFLQSRLPILSASHTIEELVARAADVRNGAAGDEDLIRNLAGAVADSPQHSQNVQRLGRRGSFAIVAGIGASLFGGHLCQLLKCMTAIKLCEELAKHSISAVPVAWIGANPLPGTSLRPVHLIDAGGQIRPVETPPGDPVIRDEISGTLSEIAKFGDGAFDSEVLEILKAAFSPGRSIQSGCARLFSVLMKEWGMVVLDPGAPEVQPVIEEVRTRVCSRTPQDESLFRDETARIADQPGDAFSPGFLIQSAILPVLACVVDPLDIYPVAASLAAFDKLGLARPAAWPRTSATVGDVRSRRTLSRYNLDLVQLYSGADEVMRGISNSLPHSAPEKLDGLIVEVESRIKQLKSIAPAEKELSATADSCGEKIVYQLGKLRDKTRAALDLKEKTANRQIHMACNWLAPNRNVQERELAFVQIPLSFSLAGLRKLYDRLDILTFEHQLIWMD